MFSDIYNNDKKSFLNASNIYKLNDNNDNICLKLNDYLYKYILFAVSKAIIFSIYFFYFQLIMMFVSNSGIGYNLSICCISFLVLSF